VMSRTRFKFCWLAKKWIRLD